MRQIPGVVTGIVKSLDDPEGQGRIQVLFPWMSENQRSAWASVAAAMAGKRRGAFFMPELEDEVLVAFDHGDFAHPFIVGFLWNGVDKPPDSDINPSVRRLKTVSGHTLDFDDNGGKERIYLKTQGGHEIEMKDAPPPAQIRIRTSGQQEVTLNDLPASVTIKTTGGNKVEITDVPPSITVSTSTGVTISATVTGITVSAPSGIITANCLQATINAGALLNVNAPMTIFTGVVQAASIITQAVVSPVYTPGIGNLLGL